MSPRSIRRAQERKAQKQAAREARVFQSQPQSQPQSRLQGQAHVEQNPALTQSTACASGISEPPRPIESRITLDLTPTGEAPKPAPSEARVNANRANAQHSTGPATPEGRAKSSLNAVKTALTGQTVLLPTDDVALYQQKLAAYAEEFAPVGHRESELVQSIADTSWRIQRIYTLESAIFAQGHLEFAEQYQDEDPETRGSSLYLATLLKYEKQLRNLNIQEARLHRRREKEMKELQELQQTRKAREQQALAEAAQLYLEAKANNQPFHQPANGFEFSTTQIERYLHRLRLSTTANAPQIRMAKAV